MHSKPTYTSPKPTKFVVDAFGVREVPYVCEGYNEPVYRDIRNEPIQVIEAINDPSDADDVSTCSSSGATHGFAENIHRVCRYCCIM